MFVAALLFFRARTASEAKKCPWGVKKPLAARKAGVSRFPPDGALCLRTLGRTVSGLYRLNQYFYISYRYGPDFLFYKPESVSYRLAYAFLAQLVYFSTNALFASV